MTPYRQGRTTDMGLREVNDELRKRVIASAMMDLHCTEAPARSYYPEASAGVNPSPASPAEIGGWLG
jgi:hypothetical protein